jgi:hypothetical protein
MAQEWVEAAFTEFMVLALVLLDVACTIWELVVGEDSFGIGWENPTNVVTGTVLVVFLFELCIRIFGLHTLTAPFCRRACDENRKLEWSTGFAERAFGRAAGIDTACSGVGSISSICYLFSHRL